MQKVQQIKAHWYLNVLLNILKWTKGKSPLLLKYGFNVSDFK